MKVSGTVRQTVSYIWTAMRPEQSQDLLISRITQIFPCR